MIERFLDWVATLPTGAVYGILGALSALENFFPPVPADTAVALGALLSLREATTLAAVFAVTLCCNTLGAMGVYLMGARHSQTLFRTRVARRLLAGKGIEFVRREYQRFGLPGLLLARLLPGVRAIVPPFAGMIHLPAAQVALVCGLASAIWYGLIIYLVATVGEHWDVITVALSRMNLALGILAAAIVVVGIVWFRRRMQRRGA